MFGYPGYARYPPMAPIVRPLGYAPPINPMYGGYPYGGYPYARTYYY